MKAVNLLTILENDRWPHPWSVKLQFDLRDIWIGAFWSTHGIPIPCTIPKHNHNKRTCITATVQALHLYICLLPCLPLHITVWHRLTATKGESTVTV